MYIDNLLLLSDAQAFTGAATASTNTIDLGNTTPKRAIGTGQAMGIGIATDVAAGASTSVKIDVIQSASADLSTPTVIATQTIAAALMPAGALFFIGIPMGYPTARYLGIQVTATGGTTTVTLTAWLTAADLFSIAWLAYAKGYAS
jgi:hypothetical protein